MAVYTQLAQHALSDYLHHHELGALRDYSGIATGIVNTNYFVHTDRGEYVLTLFEASDIDALPFVLEVTAYLARHGLPCAPALPDRDGRTLSPLAGRTAAVFPRLPGHSVMQPGPAHCALIGQALGRLHRLGEHFAQTATDRGEDTPPALRENPFGARWWRSQRDALLPVLGEEDTALLNEEIRFQSLFRLADLPRGIIHGDLFRDNVLFVGDGEDRNPDALRLSGLLDFYEACHDVLLLDVAVTVNDWCTDALGSLEPTRLHALLGAYRQERPFRPIERGAWPAMLRAAALRFWLSRLRDQHFPREGALTHIKSPEAFRQILRQHIAHRASLPL